MKIGIVGSYVPDGRVSMLKYSDLLMRSARRGGFEVVDLSPKSIFCNFKFLGRAGRLLDKLWFMTFDLGRRARGCDLVHIADQGDARYATRIAHTPVLLTCHDLSVLQHRLVADSSPSLRVGGGASGLREGQMINGLRAADGYICSSAFTLGDLSKVIPLQDKTAKVVYLPLGDRFARLGDDEAARRLEPYPLKDKLFVMHIGQAMRRKNRLAILEAAALAQQAIDLHVVIAGEPLGAEERDCDAARKLGSRIITIEKPSDDVLEALYNKAHCLLFPSYFEGFGWPVIEAQACGCPVICSNTSSLPEVAGAHCPLLDPDDWNAMSEELVKLADPQRRQFLVSQGYENLKRFTEEEFDRNQFQIYREFVASRSVAKT